MRSTGRDNQGLFRPFLWALGAHLLLGSFFLINLEGSLFPSRQSAADAAQPAIVQASMVPQQAVNQEVSRLEKLEQEQKRQQDALLQKAEDAKKASEAEEQRLAELKKQSELQQQADVVAQEKREADQKTHQLKLAEDQAKIEQEKAKAQEERVKAEQERVKVEQARTELEQARKKEQAELEKTKKALAAEEAKKKQVAEEAKKKAQEQAKKLADEQKAAQQQASKAQKERDGQVSAMVQRFGLMVGDKVSRNWAVQGATTEDIACDLKVRLAPGGVVIDVEVMRGSGSDAFDRAAVAAVYKASPLPVPQDADAFERFRVLSLTMRPDEILTQG